MIDAHYQMAQQAEEQEQLHIEEKSKFIIPDEEEVAIDAIPLATKPPCIVLSLYSICLGIDIRDDLETPVEYWRMQKHWVHKKVHMRTCQGKKVLLWRLYDSCGVHFVRFEDMHVYMLVEKRYPLTPATITDMLNKKLKSDYWNEMCYQLLKLMTKQLKNPGSGRIVGIKSFIRLFGITVALIKVSAAQEERVNAAGTKLQLLTELQLLMDKD
ncbi:hypothetical protein Tco_0304052 [Tanacetum coccineum]